MCFLIDTLGLSERRSCRIVGISRSVQQYRPAPKNDAAVVGRLEELASENRRYGIGARMRRDPRPRGQEAQMLDQAAKATVEGLAIEHRPLDALIPYASNARTHSEDQVALGGAQTRSRRAEDRLRDFKDAGPAALKPTDGLLEQGFHSC